MTREQELEAENQELRQVLSIIAATFPTALLGGKVRDRVHEVAQRVAAGKPLRDEP